MIAITSLDIYSCCGLYNYLKKASTEFEVKYKNDNYGPDKWQNKDLNPN